MAKFDPPHTLEAQISDSAGNGFTSLKQNAFNRKLNFEKKSAFLLCWLPPTPRLPLGEIN